MNLTLLQSEDYYDRRRVDTGLWWNMLRQEGYRYCDAAEEVFGKYGHLYIKIGFKDLTPNGNAILSFNEPDIRTACHPDYVEFWMKDTGIALTPVAAIGVSEALYVVDGFNVYRSHFDRLYYHGEGFYSTLRDSVVYENRMPTLIYEMP